MEQNNQNSNFSICIGREIGSGGREVALRLAEIFKLAFYDKEILYHSAKESGIAPELFENIDEMPTKTFGGNLLSLGTMFPFGGNLNSGNYLCNEELFKIQSQVIRTLADKGPSVFVGRCADYVLRDKKNVLSVFLSASYEDRQKRLCESHQFSEKEVKSVIESIDKKRAEYYNFYTFKKWGVASSYDVCLNTSVLGIDRVVKIIEDIVRGLYL